MLAINGYGKMGRAVYALAPQAMVVDPTADGKGIVRCLRDLPCVPTAIIDFSVPDATAGLCDYAVAHCVPLVVATTGHDEAQQALLTDVAKHIPVFVAANLALSVYAVSVAAIRVARTMDDPIINIHEIHRLGKRDAPGGTARAMAQALCHACTKQGVVHDLSQDPAYIGVTYQRIGDTVGVHRIELCDAYQRIQLTHAALDRGLFARGALVAADFVVGRPAGLYGMKDLYET